MQVDYILTKILSKYHETFALFKRYILGFRQLDQKSGCVNGQHNSLLLRSRPVESRVTFIL